MIHRSVATLAMIAALGAPPVSATDRVAKNFNRPVRQEAFSPTFGRTLPPIGYVRFCARNANECRALSGSTLHASLTPDRWNLLMQVNSFVNRKITPASDMEIYSVPEHWTYPTNIGDCEDYVLLKKRYLEGLGFPSETLLITVVLDEDHQGHAVLTIRSDKGDFVLDNRRNAILAWDKTAYTFLKRQSQHDPREWVAMSKKPHARSGTIAGRN